MGQSRAAWIRCLLFLARRCNNLLILFQEYCTKLLALGNWQVSKELREEREGLAPSCALRVIINFAFYLNRLGHVNSTCLIE